MWKNFEDTKANMDSYEMLTYMEYLECMKDPKQFGTDYMT